MNPISFFKSVIPKKTVLNKAAGEIKAVEKKAVKIVGNLEKDTVQLSKAATEKNPMEEILRNMLTEQGVSNKVINQLLNQEQPKMYRFIGKNELDELMAGNTIRSNTGRYSDGRTDITSNPHYGKIPTIDKYRITFKDSEKLNPFDHNKNAKVTIHALENEEYYLHGGYCKNDVEKIEHYDGENFSQVWANND